MVKFMAASADREPGRIARIMGTSWANVLYQIQKPYLSSECNFIGKE